MSFNRTLANKAMLSDHVLQVIKALEGDANLGQPIKLTALNDPANFTLDVRNLGAGGALRVKNIAGTVLFQVDETGLTLGPAVTRLIPGATSFSVRDNANANDNFIVTNAGAATVRAGLTVTAGGATIAAGGVTVTTGNVTVTAGNVVLGAAASKIVPGATSLSLRNNADSADNLLLTDAGVATVRVAFAGPGTVATTGDVRLAASGMLRWAGTGIANNACIGLNTLGVLILGDGVGNVSTSATASAGGIAIPTASGFLVVSINGAAVKIPYVGT